jgi:hypothetical protein
MTGAAIVGLGVAVVVEVETDIVVGTEAPVAVVAGAGVAVGVERGVAIAAGGGFGGVGGTGVAVVVGPGSIASGVDIGASNGRSDQATTEQAFSVLRYATAAERSARNPSRIQPTSKSAGSPSAAISAGSSNSSS